MKLVLHIVIIALLISCSNSGESSSIERGFYHWKQKLTLSEEQSDFLQKLDAELLYVKYFDLVWQNDEVVPASVLNCPEALDLEVVPTIYMTTTVFEHLDSTEIPKLVDKTAELLFDLEVSTREINEIQFDCDWNAHIRDKYFYFLTLFHEKRPEIELSSTVRLYQYKYPDIAGVPPVDKGLLMYYNMGDLMDYHEKNSILNNEIGQQYLGFNDYPLSIDIALPNFKWALLFRSGQFEQICTNFTQSELKNNDLFSQKNENNYIFKKDTVMHDTYFRFGDELRYESCEQEPLLEAVELLKNEINQNNTRVLIYDLQPHTTTDYEKISAVFDAFE